MVNVKSPVKKSVKREIIDGIYGKICIEKLACQPGHVMVGTVHPSGDTGARYKWSVGDLDEAIHTLNQVREALVNPEETL